MGVVWILLPLLRTLARVSVRAGGQLLGVALLRCLTPMWVLVRPQAMARRLAWGEEAVAVYRALMVGGRPRQGHRNGLARSLALYAHVLQLSGRYEEALAAADESLAVPGARASATQNAYTLHVRAQALAETDRLDEALTVARECVAAYRHAVPRRRDRSLGSHLGALRTYAWVLGRLPRVAESVAVYLECHALLRDMSLWQLIPVQSVQARVLIELTGGLCNLGRYDEAVAAGTDARKWTDSLGPRLYPELQPLRAQLLTDLAWSYGATRDLPRACDTAEEAVALCRALAERDPATGEPCLVLALECLAHHLGELDVLAGERRVLRELADLCARLARTLPDDYEPRLATALDVLAFRHWRQGAHRKAVESTERSADAYRSAAGRNPQAYEPELARVLADLSARQCGRGNADAAVANGREALAITRRLAESEGDTYQPLIAERLQFFAQALRRTGDGPGALACYEEAETVLRALMADADPESHEAELAAILSALAATLRTTAEAHLTAGRADEAVTALRRLLALARRADRSDVHAACLTAFARARAQAPDEVGQAWQRATTDPFPSFVYRA
ncbi:tetratricopeptide repeat protein [Streptomyces lunaelactis]|uniref:tetratricopeptide repeat protein n=1 Tax=Streptomyces lunaelactis TaxID=1535768 RepID=UPI0015845F82|nr:tetratricopeptide repeat protein [Streptomyces lunaelactis]NUJ99569.1 tetratricopeptide repeat protein [Streptomyces lunaelactis]NUK14293.1 tetratricopeptide repeat protein [Streptomyces lunaelactis]